MFRRKRHTHTDRTGPFFLLCVHIRSIFAGSEIESPHYLRNESVVRAISHMANMGHVSVRVSFCKHSFLLLHFSVRLLEIYG